MSQVGLAIHRVDSLAVRVMHHESFSTLEITIKGDGTDTEITLFTGGADVVNGLLNQLTDPALRKVISYKK